MRLIDADALIINLMDRGIEGLQTDDYSEIQQTVMAQPTIEPQSKLTNDQIWDELSKVYNMPDVPDEAKEIIGNLMLALNEEQ